LSPQITPGTADVLLGFESAEAMRWQHMLRKGGITLMNTARLVPPVVELGLYDYPEDPLAEISQFCVQQGCRLSMRRRSPCNWATSASAIHVMLGAIADYPAIWPAETLLEGCVLKRFARKGEKLVELNRQAFEAGRAARRRRRSSARVIW
jgi:indolepyruvate ferredoxin oxidoreductase, beta subunit